MKPWQTLASKTLVDDQWLKFTADRCRLPDGQAIEPYYVIHERDWVIVFAQADDGRILVVRQFRYGAKTVCVELPAGVIDPEETPMAAAQRELLEETGHTANRWRFVGRMHANAARMSNSAHFFLAQGLDRVADQDLDASETIEFEFVSLADLHHLIEDNEFSQAIQAAAFYRCLRVLAGPAC
jgi:8-oxo-dGTP pyrophosphatase MutT (NUDIX family)